MTNIQNNLTNSYFVPTFTEHDFVAILLELLYKNGVFTITEDSLSKKLYHYYNRDEFKELFQDIGLVRDPLFKQVDIHLGIYQERFFSNCIYWDTMNSKNLNLNYSINSNFSFYESRLSATGKNKIRQMAEELASIYKAERDSAAKLAIYNVNPNQFYTLIHGIHNGQIISFNLLTDGDIEKIEYPDTKGLEDFIYDSPLSLDSFISLPEKRVAYITLKNATFALKQGLCDHSLRNTTIYTENITSPYLSKLVSIANGQYPNQGKTLTEEEPFVKKLTLK